MRLANLSGDLRDFAYTVAKEEPIFQIETQAMTLDDSNTEKRLFLALVTFGRNQSEVHNPNPEFLGSLTCCYLDEELKEIMQEAYRYGYLFF